MNDKPESVIREALAEIQRRNLFGSHPDLTEQQLAGAVRIVMQHLAQRCPEVPAIETNDAADRTNADHPSSADTLLQHYNTAVRCAVSQSAIERGGG